MRICKLRRKPPDLGVHFQVKKASLTAGTLSVPEEALAAKALLYLPGRMAWRRPRPYASGSSPQRYRSEY
jgi:hypothetical protein